jgi:polysaccharide export outer membrane protein
MRITRLISGPTPIFGLVLFAISITLCGCGDKFWDPTQVGRFRPVPAVNVILDSLGVAEETPPSWETGEEPRPADTVAYETDYVFGPGDIVTISIYELLTQGAMYANQFAITETGKISIPDVGVVQAAGLTESQLEEEIRQILSPTILKEPSVSVTLAQSQSRVFSILGSGVPRPGRYAIPRYDFRLADALAVSGGIGQFNISYVYVSRPISGEEPLAQPETTKPAETLKPEVEKTAPVKEPRQEMLEVIAPSAKATIKSPKGNEYVLSSAEMVTNKELAEAALPDSLLDTRNGSTEPVEVPPPKRRASNIENRESSNENNEGRIEWIFQDGRWVPVKIGQPTPPPPTAEKIATERAPAVERKETGAERRETGWEQIGPGGAQRRTIRIPTDKLLSGESRYNIVIQPGDNIHVPVDIIGEFCIMGNVNSQGFINITGRPMTLKMAIAAAGGLGPLAWPKKCEVVRRIGKKREEIVMVDLDKIAMGEQPDFFIKPNDLINVGTHPTARWRAVLRNAFRATYGFGFIYDRNFADRDYGTGRPFDFLTIF